MRLTPFRRKNLTKLADYLESLPKDYRHFEMSVYLDNHGDDQDRIRQYAEHNGGVPECGAVACAVGHGPAAGMLFPKPSKRSALWSYGSWSGFTPEWDAYAKKFLIDRRNHGSAWEWCFGSNWADVDNHHYGAAARIRYLLAGNKPPQVKVWNGEMQPFNDAYADETHVALYQEFRK